MPCGSLLILAFGPSLAQGHSRDPWVPRALQQVTSERSFGNPIPIGIFPNPFYRLQIGLQRVFNSLYLWLLLLWAGGHGFNGAGCLLQSLLQSHLRTWATCLVEFSGSISSACFATVPSWPIKAQGLVFSSAFWLVWLASHILLEPEGRLCSVIFLVIFLPFSFQAGTEANAGYSM